MYVCGVCACVFSKFRKIEYLAHQNLNSSGGSGVANDHIREALQYTTDVCAPTPKHAAFENKVKITSGGGESGVVIDQVVGNKGVCPFDKLAPAFAKLELIWNGEIGERMTREYVRECGMVRSDQTNNLLPINQ